MQVCWPHLGFIVWYFWVSRARVIFRKTKARSVLTRATAVLRGTAVYWIHRQFIQRLGSACAVLGVRKTKRIGKPWVCRGCVLRPSGKRRGLDTRPFSLRQRNRAKSVRNNLGCVRQKFNRHESGHVDISNFLDACRQAWQNPYCPKNRQERVWRTAECALSRFLRKTLSYHE